MDLAAVERTSLIYESYCFRGLKYSLVNIGIPESQIPAISRQTVNPFFTDFESTFAWKFDSFNHLEAAVKAHLQYFESHGVNLDQSDFLKINQCLKDLRDCKVNNDDVSYAKNLLKNVPIIDELTRKYIV